MNPFFWEGKKVLVTGHTGFKGSWLCLWLQHLGADLTGYALKPTYSPSLFELANVSNGMNSVIGDIRDAENLKGVFAETQPEIVIHLAAQPLVRKSYLDPLETYSTNVIGLVNLFEAVRFTPSVKSLLNVTTDKCYENKEWLWGYRESDRLGGLDPYSNSKACAELITSTYRHSYFNKSHQPSKHVCLASARAGNVIGGGDWAQDRLIPDIVRAIELGEIVSIRNPDAIRPWQHVLEPLRGYLLLAEKLYTEGNLFAGPFNFGPNDDDAMPVRWITERLIMLWGGAQWHIDNKDHPHEANMLKLDCSKAKKLLKWQPCWNLETTLTAIVAWHKAMLNGQDMRAFTLNQINEYSRSLNDPT